MLHKHISKVVVLGSGVMGTGIAAHLAGCGMEVLLLDIPAAEGAKFRDMPARENLQKALKARPAPFYDNSFAARITTGNFDDDLPGIASADWIIEVVVERLDIKKQLFARVDQYRRKGSLISSNTSGIPIHLIAGDCSADFRRHFLGTHFFNPVRYMRLLEIIPTPETDPEIVDFFMDLGDRVLGKQTVLCKDTPAFIANRIGVYLMANIIQLSHSLGLDVATVDRLTGPLIGRPKTGTFRLGDLVGIDTLVHVVNGLRQNCTDDAQVQSLEIPKSLDFLVDHKFLGDKTGKGFYQNTGKKDEKGKPVLLALDLETLEYGPTKKVSLPVLDSLKQQQTLQGALNVIFKGTDNGAELLQRSFLNLFAYSANRIPGISDTIYAIDDAMRAGFAWEKGPFELWDLAGVAKMTGLAEEKGIPVALWVKDMLAAGNSSFYRLENGQRYCYHPTNKQYEPVPGGLDFLLLDNLRENRAVYHNSDATLHDIGDGVLCLEFHSKMNSIGEGILDGLWEAVRLAEEEGWKGLVIGNNAPNFSAGANLLLIAMLAGAQDWDEINLVVGKFQQTSMRLRYSAVPVVTATQGMVLGGGCEIAMHSDAVMAAAESYFGLVEAGVGLIPGGGGTKEFTLRLSDDYSREGDVQIPSLIKRFKTIATAQVSGSAYAAFDPGYLRSGIDHVVHNTARNLAKAKAKVLELSDGYIAPIPRKDITVLGRTGLGALYLAAHSLQLGNYASAHDIKIARKTAWVLCGGDLTSPQQVSEQYLLNLEREAFLSLCGEPLTLARIQHMLSTGKPLRN